MTYFLPYFIHHFQEFCNPLGFSFNLRHETKILSSTTTGQFPLPYLSPQNCFHLQSTIKYLKSSSGSQTSPEAITTGAGFLGFPVGSTTFANDNITTKSFDAFNNDLSKLTS